MTDTTDTLRAAIEAALRRRDPSAKVLVGRPDGFGHRRVRVLIGSVDADTEQASADAALRDIAVSLGLRVTDDDVTDPAEECERLRLSLARAHHTVRKYGPRCSHPQCERLAPLRCDDCGERFCEAHDEGGEGHGEAVTDRHAIGPDDLMAGAAMREAEVSQ